MTEVDDVIRFDCADCGLAREFERFESEESCRKGNE